MKIFKNIIIAIIILVVVVMVVGYFSPQNVTLERSVTINATPASIFEEINGMKAFNAWNPWASIDPEGTSYEFTGPDYGVGSKMAWTSENSDVGTGNQEIVESVQNEKVRSVLYFDNMETPSYANLELSAEDDATKVTWTFEGDMGTNPIGKIFGHFMESMLGPSYEEGLNNLKKLAESKPEFNIEPSVTDLEAMNYLGIRQTFSMEDKNKIGDQMGMLYGKILSYMASNKIEAGGMPMSVHYVVNDSIWECDIAMPVASETQGNGEIKAGATYAGKALAVTHRGDYMLLENTHKEIQKYMEYKQMESNGNPYEQYVTDPGNVLDTAQWITQIYYPIK